MHFRVIRAVLLAVLGSYAPLWAATDAPGAPTAAAVRALVEDTTRFWSQQFARLGGRYVPPGLTLFSGQIGGACGQKAVLSGPFYCPADQHLYVDTLFLSRLAARGPDTGVPAEGFVIAHLVAHHVQYLIGTTALVQQARSTSTPENANRTLVTLELQADCYAGLWLHAAPQRGALAVTLPALPGLLAAASAESRVLSKALAAGAVQPDPLDVGEPAQRLRWVRQGLDNGAFEGCDTFGAVAAGKL